MVKADLLQGFSLGELRVDPATGQVEGPAGTVHLPSKAMEVLLGLASRPGEVVTREVLLEEVWGPGRGSQEALSHAISETRHALGDHHDAPKYIQTLPRRGYRLLVSPEVRADHTSSVVIGAGDGFRPEELGLFENLKQRGVLETALAYLIFGWLIIQVADIVFEHLLLPQWAGTFVTVFVIAGFPIALLLSWFLEFRHGRAVVYEPTSRTARRKQFSRTYISVIAALSIAALFVFIYDRNIGLPAVDVEPPSVAVEETRLPPVQDNAIAVLPFFNIDGSKETQIFADGLVDDVITRLSRVPGLLVSSRGDSHTLAPNSPSEEVRERLRVAMYLEGSVQMSGDEIRVIMQLIDSATGFHKLSRSFDRPRSDFFDIRDEITELTAANVQIALPDVAKGISYPLTDDPSLDVYVLYRRGIDASRRARTVESVAEALEFFDAALALDPDYAAALAGKCDVYVKGYAITNEAAYIDNAEAACSRALQLNPNLDVVHTALGDLYRATGEHAKAESAYARALETNPGNSSALIGLGFTYMNQQRSDQAEQTFARAIGLHPGDWSAFNALGSYYYRTGRYADAAAQFEYVVALDRGNMMGRSNLGTAQMLAGDFTAAAATLRETIEIEPRSKSYSNLGLVAYYRGELDEAIESHRKAVEQEPNDHLNRSNLGDALWVAGLRDEAIEEFRLAEGLGAAALQVNPNDPFTRMDMAWISTMLGKKDDARRFIELARADSPDDPYVDYIEGLMFAHAGDPDAAFAVLERALDNGYPREILAADPQLVSLRQYSRFSQLLARTKSP